MKLVQSSVTRQVRVMVSVLPHPATLESVKVMVTPPQVSLPVGVPVVVGKQGSAATEVILAVADDCGAPVQLADRDFHWQGSHANFSVDAGDRHLDDLSCALSGRHQLDNFAQAVAGALELRKQGVAITDAAISMAGRTVTWPGRLEWCGDSQEVLLDVSHNLAGITCLADYLAERNVSRIHLLTGLSGERDPAEVLMPLAKCAAAVYAVPVSYGQSVPVNQVVAWAETQGLSVSAYATAGQGLAAALKDASHAEPVVVCGSLYLVAELRQELLEGNSTAVLDL